MLPVLLAIWVGLFAQVSLTKKCPITSVPSGGNRCNAQALIRRPATLAVYKNLSEQECERRCLDNKTCRSSQWVEKGGKCYLYKKYLDQMFPDYDNFGPGIISDRNCLTTNCKVIESCNATASCTGFAFGFSGSYFDILYEQYACSFGRTSKSTYPDGTPIPIYNITMLDGSYSACSAARQCAPPLPYGSQSFDYGSFDIHYDIPSDQWVCVNYQDAPNAAPTLEEEGITRNRYTAKNNTVGAGYGYRLVYAYFTGACC